MMTHRIPGLVGAAFFAALIGAAPASAIKLENYQKYRLDSRSVNATFKSMIEVRMEGVLQGIILASRAIKAAGGQPQVCAPDTLQMRGPEVVKMLDDEINNGRTAAGQPYGNEAMIEDVLFAAARKRWPCAR
jgi:hypothetical protein